jgi:hypothetical protein
MLTLYKGVHWITIMEKHSRKKNHSYDFILRTDKYKHKKCYDSPHLLKVLIHLYNKHWIEIKGFKIIYNIFFLYIKGKVLRYLKLCQKKFLK